MKRLHKLPSAAWVNGGNIQIPIKDIPARAKIRGFVFTLEGLFTTGAAAAAIASTQLHRLVSMLTIGPTVRASGIFWRFLDWSMRGGETVLPAGLPATNASAFRRNVTWYVPYLDKRAAFPTDDLPFAAEFAEQVISIDTAAFTGLDGGTNTWNTLASIAGTLRAWAVLDNDNGSPGSVVKYGFADLTGQAPTIEPGLYTDLFLYRENAGTIDSTQVTTAAIQVDGSVYCDDLRHREYAYAFDRDLDVGGTYESASATAPAAGELVNDQPAATAGAADTVTNPFMPLVWSPWGYKKSDALIATSALRIDFTGSDTTFRIGYRKVLPRSGSEMEAAFARVGQSVPVSKIAGKTGSKKDLTGAAAGLAAYLPLRKIS